MKPTILLMALFTALPMGGAGQSKESRRIATANDVLEDIPQIPDQTIPGALLRDALGVAVVPEVLKAALGLGGRWGEGVLLVARPQGGWSGPVFISLTGGSIGWQEGVQSTDLVLVFTSRRSITTLQRGTLTPGVDAAIAAGPVGREARAGTDPQLHAEILAYSRGRGFFAGVTVHGAQLSIDAEANERFYDEPNVTAGQILAGQVCSQSPAARQLRQTLRRLSGGR